ncbi:MFS transporter [Bacillus cereus group sp. BfR-BA-01380]|uniref:MFS transporter n=1 Tax=Bacillus cereus group sp. BfR-BA-01380 TaxID=2920324 RepID=UPI001F569FD1|nr:MFS transporter [Bacillus cereus group sp. BfR-BA-01380]
MDKPQLWTKDFISIAITNFLVFTTFYYLLVTLPIYALQELHGAESEAGLITTVFLIASILTRPLAGKWIEKSGKYIVFISSLLVLFAASIFYFIPQSVIGLLILRFFHGIGFGMATTATGAIVADLIPDSRKGEGMGYYGLTLNLGMAIGPFLGLTVMQQAGTTFMFIINALCALFALVAGLFVKLPRKTVMSERTMERKTGMKIGDYLEIPTIPVSMVSAFFALIYSGIVSFVSIYAKEHSLVEAAGYFFVVYAVVLLISRPFTGKWFDLFGANIIIYPAILCFAIGTFLLSISNTSLLFLSSAALIGLGWGTTFPSLQTIAIQVAPPKKRALATATFLSIFDFGFGIGSFIFGIAAAKIDHSSLYFYCSFLIIIGIGVYYLLHGRLSSRSIAKKVKKNIS